MFLPRKLCPRGNMDKYLHSDKDHSPRQCQMGIHNQVYIQMNCICQNHGLCLRRFVDKNTSRLCNQEQELL